MSEKVEISKDLLEENIKLINKLSFRVGKLSGALEMLILEAKLKDLDLEIDVEAYEKILNEDF